MHRNRARRLLTFLTAVLVLAPVLSAAASNDTATPQPNTFYGTWYDAMSPSRQEAQAALKQIAGQGIGTIRQYIFWDRVETSPGVYDWSRLDGLFQDAADNGLTVMPTLLYTPSFYEDRPAGARASYPPSDPQKLADFATALIKRYGPRGTYWCPPTISDGGSLSALKPAGDAVDSLRPCDDSGAVHAWEVWNEPDWPSWWKGKPSPAEYVALLRAVSKAIRAADPKAEVVLGALTGEKAEKGFLAALYDLGAGPLFDTIAFNPYTVSVKDLMARVKAVRAVAASHGDRTKPIRILEYGWATGGRSTLTVTTFACQAALLYTATTELTKQKATYGITGIVQFQWHDVPTTTTAWPHYAGVLRADGSAKPSFAAIAAAVAGKPAPPTATLAACPKERRPTR
jgi:hypothetical protein